MRERPIFVVLAEGRFGPEGSKTAASAIRYLPGRVTAVLDSTHAGRTAADVLGFGAGVPVVGTLEEALERDPRPEALLIGVAPQGGGLPDAWRPLLLRAVEEGLDLWSGLHHFLAEDAEIEAAARRAGVRLHDLRRTPRGLPVATGLAAGTDAFRLLTVGTDCNVGKMTTALELRRALDARGLRTAFAATGQTGILVEGWGIAVDAVVADFVAGAAERLVLEAAGETGAGRGARVAERTGSPELVLVEGQGSLLHPGYSGVTLALLHGSLPDAMVLCWMPSRPTLYGGSYDWVPVPPLPEVIRIYEEAASWVRPGRPCPVVAVSCSTYDLPEEEARHHVEEARRTTGLPATDPVRFGTGPLVRAVVRAMEAAVPGAQPSRSRRKGSSSGPFAAR